MGKLLRAAENSRDVAINAFIFRFGFCFELLCDAVTIDAPALECFDAQRRLDFLDVLVVVQNVCKKFVRRFGDKDEEIADHIFIKVTENPFRIGSADIRALPRRTK